MTAIHPAYAWGLYALVLAALVLGCVDWSRFSRK